MLWIVILTVAAPIILAPSLASAETRTLKLYFVHTKEKAEIAFKKDGRYLSSGLAQLNRFLRDWRRNEPTKMDPRLFDLVWQVYRASGARDYIHVVSAYRSPATNSMLRSRSRGVAKRSQHTLGKAMDFFIPGVPLKKLRYIGMRYQAGGVGYYPRSGSPFVHMDVGNVRHWPRMSRKELLAVFPNGKTLHVPTDGKPLPGYEQALAAYEARKARGGSIAVASAKPRKSKTLFAALFGGGADEEEDTSESGGESRRAVAVASVAKPSRAVPRAPVAAPEAPARAPQPEPQPQPAAIVAALPPREVPRPLDAPRPAASLAEATPEGQAALAFAVPVPGRKPQSAIAMVAPPADVPTPPVDVPASSAEAINAAVDANSARIADAGVPNPSMNGFVPVPLNKPEHTDPSVLLASAVVPDPRPETGVFVAAADAEALARAAEPKRDEIADVVEANMDTPAFPLPQSAPPPRSQQVALVIPEEPETSPDMVASVSPASATSPRKALLDAAAKGQPINAIDTGVRTTAKGAKPHRGEAREPEAIVQPASAPMPQMAISSTSVSRAVPVTSPILRSDALRSAPTTVYTAGFQRELPSDNANKFSGNAVTFLSIAKFSATN
nr:DUF882 domain-containing protein [Phyllobacterium phragmitis]